MDEHVSVIKNVDAQFLHRWQELWETSPDAHFFNAPAWFVAYCDAYEIKEYHIIIVEKDTQLQAVLPLVTTRLYGISLLCSPGGRFLDKSTLLFREKDAIRPLITALSRMDTIYLRELSSEVADILVGINKDFVKHEASINPYIALHDDAFQFVSPKQKSKIKNKIIKNKDHLLYKSYKGDPQALETAFVIDAKSAKGKKGKATFLNAHDKTFFRQLLQKNKEHVVIDVVSYDGIPFVYQIGFLYKRICLGVNTAYLPEYRALSPGKLLLYFMLRELQKEKIDLFDFSRGESVIKKEFTPLFYKQYDVLYTKYPFVRYWLLSLQSIRWFIVQNKLFYGIYLFFKTIMQR